VGLASRGQRDMDTGAEVITDAAELAQVRAQARRVNLNSLLAASVCTALSLTWP
jgi:hypothetical protein